MGGQGEEAVTAGTARIRVHAEEDEVEVEGSWQPWAHNLEPCVVRLVKRRKGLPGQDVRDMSAIVRETRFLHALRGNIRSSQLGRH